MLMACNSFSVMQCDFRVHVWSTIPAGVSNKAEWFLAWSLWSDQLCKTLDPVLVEFFPLLITPTNQLNLYSLLLYNWETILWHHCLLAPKKWWFWNLCYPYAQCNWIVFFFCKHCPGNNWTFPLWIWKKKLWKQGENPKFNQWPKLALDMFRKK